MDPLANCAEPLKWKPCLQENKGASLNARRTEGDSRISIQNLARQTARSDIEFRDVSFKYPARDAHVFVNLNMRIESGQFVALVGPSGCGKSTVISLLEQFYKPTHGTIIFGGQDIRTTGISSYRSVLALVAQEPKLFDGSIRENVFLGLGETESNPASTEATEDAMISACKDAEIHDFITSLPEGYATGLGVNAQVSLSGGQKQRLCIARALIRKPALLLLDEATSSLDSHSENLVQGAMELLAMKREVTTIAVAHRLYSEGRHDFRLWGRRVRTGVENPGEGNSSGAIREE